ncbi:MAG: M15 family metallopeptidase [Patescibacteria group bacterium]
MFLNWKNLSLEAVRNRLLLAKTMVNEGFWLFPGEFWHFSSGDAESAAAIGAQKSKYAQIPRFSELPR